MKYHCLSQVSVPQQSLRKMGAHKQQHRISHRCKSWVQKGGSWVCVWRREIPGTLSPQLVEDQGSSQEFTKNSNATHDLIPFQQPNLLIASRWWLCFNIWILEHTHTHHSHRWPPWPASIASYRASFSRPASPSLTNTLPSVPLGESGLRRWD